MQALEALFRWIHILFGIIWIGLLYFFNFVNTPFAGTMDGDTKKKVVPELMPRALFWFRWGAAWTWVTGVLLLLLVFYHGGIMFDAPNTWNASAILMIVLVFLAPFAYDVLAKSPLGKSMKTLGMTGFVLIAILLLLMVYGGHYSYRAYNIHVGAMLGTIMAWNVWFRIWPSQKKIITAVKAGTPPDAAIVAVAGSRSRHNVYMSVPLLWTMINAHTTALAGGKFGITASIAWLVLLIVVLLGWHIVWHLYKKAGKVKGF